jgi:hypothetical protein
MFVNLDGEGTARNISEGRKILYSGEMESKGINIYVTIKIYSKNYHRKI